MEPLATPAQRTTGFGELLLKALSLLLLVETALMLVETWAPIGPTFVQQLLASLTAAAVFLVFFAVALRWRDRNRFLPWLFPALCVAGVTLNWWLHPFTSSVLQLTKRGDNSLVTAAAENNHPLIKHDLGFYYWLRPILDGRELIYTPETRKYFDLLLIRSAAHLRPRAIAKLPPVAPGRMEELLKGPLEMGTLYDGTPVRIALDHGNQRYVLITEGNLLVFAPEGALWEPDALKLEP